MADLELIRRIAKGDEQAFTTLYLLLQEKVYNTALHYLQQTENAEEITQDVFVEIFRSASGFDGKSSVTTWVYRITVNKCLDKIRYMKARKRFHLLSFLFSTDSGNRAIDHITSAHDPFDNTEQRENSRLLLQSINRLGEQQKTAVILTQLEGLSLKETAAIMNITPKAVESLVQRGKANLKKTLGKIFEENRRKQP